MIFPRLLICDLGGTLRQFVDPTQQYPTGTPGEWVLCPAVAEKLQAHLRHGGYLGIATNQPYIETGHTTEATVRKDIDAVLAAALDIDMTSFVRWIAICPHGPTAGCPCRKPSPYMLLAIAMGVHWKGVTLKECLYVGDSPEDKQAAWLARIRFQWAGEYFAL